MPVKLILTPKIVQAGKAVKMTMPIVLADDEPQVRSLIKRMLTKQGFVVLEAENGLNAFTIIRKLHGDISALISDIDMPKLDGAALCRMVKETFPSIPVVLMSGNTELAECNVGDAFLWKPSQIHLLLSVVSGLCLKNHGGGVIDRNVVVNRQ